MFSSRTRGVTISSNEKDFVIKVTAVMDSSAFTGGYCWALQPIPCPYCMQALEVDHRIDGRRPIDHRHAEFQVLTIEILNIPYGHPPVISILFLYLPCSLRTVHFGRVGMYSSSGQYHGIGIRERLSGSSLCG